MDIASTLGNHMTRSEKLKSEIDIFLGLTGMKPTNFGKAALNDPAFYGKLRNGRRLFSETEDRVRQYMIDYARVQRVAA